MAIDRRPWRKKYVHDWRTSRTVRMLTWEQRGVFDWLLDEQWVDGGLPADPATVAQMIGAPVDAVESVLEAAFPVGDDGLRWNVRAEEMRDETEAEADRLSAAGAAGGRASGESRKRKPRKGKQKERSLNDGRTIVEPSLNDRATIPKHSDPDSDPDSEPTPVRDSIFVRFRNAYPEVARKRETEVAAWKLWQKVPKRDREKVAAYVEARASGDEQWRKEDGRFAPGIGSFLRQRGWKLEWVATRAKPGERVEAMFDCRHCSYSAHTADDRDDHEERCINRPKVGEGAVA